MTEQDIQKVLFTAFETLNDFSGIKLIEDNVAYPNKPFDIPENKRWYIINCLANSPEYVFIGCNRNSRWNGFLQIDICTPLDKGEEEATNKYEWLRKLFENGKYFEFVEINKCYIATKTNNSDHYRMTVRIEWTADITD